MKIMQLYKREVCTGISLFSFEPMGINQLLRERLSLALDVIVTFMKTLHRHLVGNMHRGLYMPTKEAVPIMFS